MMGMGFRGFPKQLKPDSTCPEHQTELLKRHSMDHTRRMATSERGNTAHEHVNFWRDPALDGAPLLHARYLTHRFARHVHDGYALGVITAGVEAFDYRGTRHYACAGDIVAVAPDEVHTGSAGHDGGWAYRMVYPDAHRVQALAREACGWRAPLPFFPDPVIRDPDLAASLASLHRALEQGVDRLAGESGWLMFIDALVRRHAQVRTARPDVRQGTRAVTRARELLHGSLDASLPLETLSRHAGMAAAPLVRAFTREIGLPPHAYHLQLRLRYAAGLLRDGIPVAEAALAAGFVDQSHLTRHFKRWMGLTPAVYAGMRSRTYNPEHQ